MNHFHIIILFIFLQFSIQTGILLVATQISSEDKMYPDWSCQKGFGHKPKYDGDKFVNYAKYGMENAHDYCYSLPNCYKQCVLEYFGIVRGYGKGGLYNESFIGEYLRSAVFYEDDGGTALRIAKEIHSKCSDLGKALPLTEDTNGFCEGLDKFHACVEATWKC